MRVGLRVASAVFLVIVGAAAGAGWFLLGEGLDRAEKWVSIVGVCVSIVMGAGGLLLAWLTWRQSRAGESPTVAARGAGAVGVRGSSGGSIRTDISGVVMPTSGPAGSKAGVDASGTGSVAVGGDSTAPISTRVTGSTRRPSR